MAVLATVAELGGNDTIYGVVLFLHILCAIAGFGGVMLNGLYGAEAGKRPGPGGLAIGQANYAVSGVAEKFIYAVFVLGIALVFLAENDTIEFGDSWVWLSILLYVVAIGFSHSQQIPNARKMNELAEELVNAGPPPEGAQGPPPQVAQMEAVGKKLAGGGIFLNLMVLAVLYLMIFKPGWG
jgi:uncharacterized membrane protein